MFGSSLHPRDTLEQVATGSALPPGWQATFLREVASTQDVARAAARDGAPGRSVFVADYQSAGRGRQGRVWVAPPGSSLMLSVLFRDTAPEPAPQRYTMLVALALAEAVEQVAPSLQPAIKWPNDVMLGQRKVAGVLAEAAWDGERLAVIVGCGVNVNLTEADVSAVGPTATSLSREAGQPLDRGALLAALLARLDVWLARSPAELFAAWHARLWGRGQRIRLRGLEGATEQELEVVVLSAEPDGALRVRLADGSERRTTTSEVIL